MKKPEMTMSRKKINPSSPIDNLSALPDEIICQILSFLPTKTSVSTSILARRWRFLWAHVPNLHFAHNSQELSIDTIYSKVLLHYSVKDMNAFLLHSDDESCSRPHLQACIEYAIRRKVKQIDLKLHFPNSFPSCIFACTTVVDMKLSGHGNIPTTDEDISLPALKKLYLSQVRYEYPETLPHLLSGCPVLEELTIDRWRADVHCLVVSSSTINRLDISTNFVKLSDTRFTVRIDAPAVRYLAVRDIVSSEVSVAGKMDSLIEADVFLDNHWISNGNEDSDDDDASVDWGFGVDFDDYVPVEWGVNIDGPDYDVPVVEGDANDVSDNNDDDDVFDNNDDDVSDSDDDDSDSDSDDSDDDVSDSDDDDDVVALNNEARKEEDVRYARSVLEFVGRLSNVKYLKFTTRWMDVSDLEFSMWSVKFNNLTKLELRSDWRFIPNFLENADNLEALTISGDDEHLKQWIEPKEVPACLLSHLGIVRINSFGCADQEFQMIEYIMRNAKVLKRMIIQFEGDGIGFEKKHEARNKISLFPMGSVECALRFY